jgi:hypothetical protein
MGDRDSGIRRVARNGWRVWLPVAAAVIAAVGTLAVIVGIPTCGELVTKTEAEEMHDPIEARIDSVEKHNEADHAKIFDELKTQREESKEQNKEIIRLLRRRPR